MGQYWWGSISRLTGGTVISIACVVRLVDVGLRRTCGAWDFVGDGGAFQLAASVVALLCHTIIVSISMSSLGPSTPVWWFQLGMK